MSIADVRSICSKSKLNQEIYPLNDIGCSEQYQGQKTKIIGIVVKINVTAGFCQPKSPDQVLKAMAYSTSLAPKYFAQNSATFFGGYSLQLNTSMNARSVPSAK